MIVANWKMNGSKEEVDSWLRFVSSNITPNKDNLCIFCPPSCYLDYSSSLIKEIASPVQLGSQNINFSENSALTGGISSQMLKDLSTEHVLIGHSEQRQYFNEENDSLKSKITDALTKDISPIFCIGEPQEIKAKNRTKDYLFRQLEILESFDSNLITIAYEPIWAIGSGLIPKESEIFEIVKFIKKKVKGINVLYGGSVNSKNINVLKKINNVNGFLIGGASQKSKNFIDIIKKTFN